jgi:hypothetical protein
VLETIGDRASHDGDVLAWFEFELLLGGLGDGDASGDESVGSDMTKHHVR